MHIEYSEEVSSARESGTPIVGLESTVIAHGLPYPQNLETALSLEEVVKENGAVPATIALIDGSFRIGLTSSEIEHLASNRSVRKVTIRDLPVAVAKKETCATTVASTLFACERAGIEVFATGGIGGVHRGNVGDVSADLPALASVRSVTVCSGPKIVLDLGATREWLETNGITLLGFRCDEMPAFYTSASGLTVDKRIDSLDEVCEIVRARNDLGLHGSVVLAVPVPEEHSVDEELLEQSLADSIVRADEEGVAGKELTPFLLRELSRISGGKTIEANIALLKNNARVASRLATKLRPAAS